MPAKNPEIKLRTTRLFELSIVTESFSRIFQLLTTHDRSTLLVATPNPEQVVLTQESREFQHTLQSMDVLLPDGIGLVLASRVFAGAGKAVPIMHRVTGVDVVKAVLIEAAETGKAVLVIGGRGYNRLSSPAIQFKDGNVRILEIPASQGANNCYWLEGYANAHTPTKEESEEVAKVITKLKPEYIFIALGAPLQEQWLLAHEDLLNKNKVRVAMAVGGTFDILTGKLDRAPAWMLKLNFEWLYRLYQEPWRWRRQLNLLKFIKLVVQEVLN